jgi:hypothetical protein
VARLEEELRQRWLESADSVKQTAVEIRERALNRKPVMVKIGSGKDATYKQATELKECPKCHALIEAEVWECDLSNANRANEGLAKLHGLITDGISITIADAEAAILRIASTTHKTLVADLGKEAGDALFERIQVALAPASSKPALPAVITDVIDAESREVEG